MNIKKLPYCILGFLFLLLAAAPADADEIVIDDFKDGLKKQWRKKVFDGETDYFITVEDGRECIKAVSEDAASGLFYKIEFDPKQYPVISWSWKVENIIESGNALTREGDDYAARIYVVFPSVLFWRTKAINYIWANKLKQNTAVPNPFTENDIMIAVESGPARVGQWVEERHNIYEDFKKQFGFPPPKAGAIAIMTDTDNTGENATAYYGPIKLHSGN